MFNAAEVKIFSNDIFALIFTNLELAHDMSMVEICWISLISMENYGGKVSGQLIS
jgi:hypothetical protein